jgi:3D (Asp-Asp-Asp) domain-containing protein
MGYMGKITMKRFNFILLLSVILAGVWFYTCIQLINTRNTLAEQRIISDQQTEIINTLKADNADLEERLAQRFSQIVSVTAYCQNDANTAIGEDPEPGTCAISDDLLEIYPFGTSVYIEGYGVWRVNNSTNNIWTNTIDLYIGNCQEALEFGRITARATRIIE